MEGEAHLRLANDGRPGLMREAVAQLNEDGRELDGTFEILRVDVSAQLDAIAGLTAGLGALALLAVVVARLVRGGG